MFDVGPMADLLEESQIAQLLATSPGALGHFLSSGFMDCGMIARSGAIKVAGTVLTVRVTAPDSVIGHYVLKLARPGDVLLVERGPDQNVSNYGMAAYAAAAKAGVRGIIIDGAGHDAAEAARFGLGLWCRRIVPVTTQYRRLGGAINVPISCGGVVAQPGDAVLADANGVIVIPRNDLAGVLAKAASFEAMKATILGRIANEPDFIFPDASGSTGIVEEVLAASAASHSE